MCIRDRTRIFLPALISFSFMHTVVSQVISKALPSGGAQYAYGCTMLVLGRVKLGGRARKNTEAEPIRNPSLFKIDRFQSMPLQLLKQTLRDKKFNRFAPR